MSAPGVDREGAQEAPANSHAERSSDREASQLVAPAKALQRPGNLGEAVERAGTRPGQEF